MRKLQMTDALATMFSIAVLIFLIAFVVHMLVPPSDWEMDAGIGCAVLIPINLYYCVGNGKEKLGNPTTIGWLGLSLTVFIFACISMLMDCGTGFLFHTGSSSCDAGMKGLGFMFTVLAGGVALTFLAGAVRSGLLELLRKSGHGVSAEKRTRTEQ